MGVTQFIFHPEKCIQRGGFPFERVESKIIEKMLRLCKSV